VIAYSHVLTWITVALLGFTAVCLSYTVYEMTKHLRELRRERKLAREHIDGWVNSIREAEENTLPHAGHVEILDEHRKQRGA